MSDLARSSPTVMQRLLGGFVGVQLVFLALANFLPFLPHGRPDPGELMDDVTISGRTFDSDLLQGALNIAGTATRRYAERTGQMQGWSLFAPLVATQSPFLVTELRWHDDAGEVIRREQLVSRFLPADPDHFYTCPGTDCRLLNYEFRVSHPMWFLTDESLHERPAFWQEWMCARVRKQQKTMRAYLRIRAAEFAVAHPGESPADEMLLLARLYRIPGPYDPAAEKLTFVDRPMVRYRPQFGSALEYFDPVEERYVHLAPAVGDFAHE